MEDNNIIIRQTTLKDLRQLTELYDRVWPEFAGHHEKKTKWMLESSEYIGYCAESNDSLIGSRNGFYTNFYYDKEKLCCVQLLDSCVDAKFRRFGLFTRMNKAFLHDLFKTGDELIYNISVDASRKAYEKLGWVYIKSLSHIIYFPNLIGFLWKTRFNIGKLAGNMTPCESPIPDINCIPEDLLAKRESFIGDGKLHTKYDKETLQWRLGTDSSIRLFYDVSFGACFYKIGNKNGLCWLNIGEMFLTDYNQRIFNKVIEQLKHQYLPDVISVTISHAHPLYKFYKNKGFICNPKKVYLNHGVKVESERMKKLCLNPDNWAISDLDIDTF